MLHRPPTGTKKFSDTPHLRALTSWITSKVERLTQPKIEGSNLPNELEFFPIETMSLVTEW